jgi:acyl-CoA dehydrogenase
MLRQRETFGKPLIKHQAIRHKIADMSAPRSTRWTPIMQMVAWRVNERDATTAPPCPPQNWRKSRCSRPKPPSSAPMRPCRSWAAPGYLRGCAIERIYREVKVMAIGGGSEEIMRDLAVKQMGL